MCNLRLFFLTVQLENLVFTRLPKLPDIKITPQIKVKLLHHRLGKTEHSMERLAGLFLMWVK